jgi:hypothetical protein
MKYHSAFSRARRNQGGYALLLVVFFITLLVVSTVAVAPRVLTEGKRQREQEMIWRGKQYTRGIKLYYRKLGRFPNSIDDLTKPKVGNLRFMRQAYTDPMNKDDGAWRLIYVGPAGQLIGSLKPPQTPFTMPNAGGLQGAAGAPAAGGLGTSSTSQTGGFSLGSTTQAPGAPGATGTPPGTAGTATGTDSGQPAAAPGTVGGSTDPSQIPTGDTPTIMGGNIIGVGSKINQSSIIVYETATNYRLFEFVWDPSKDMGLTGGAGSMIGAPAGGIPGGGTSPGSLGGFGQNPAGGTPSGTTPPPTPPTTPPTSTPQQ